jgi:hypothetical protein
VCRVLNAFTTAGIIIIIIKKDANARRNLCIDADSYTFFEEEKEEGCSWRGGTAAALTRLEWVSNVRGAEIIL